MPPKKPIWQNAMLFMEDGGHVYLRQLFAALT